MANLNLSEFTEKLFVADADHTFIWDTAASISKRVSRNSWLNSGTLTSDAPVTISQTWNAGSNVMTALKVVATDTASGATSNLLELWAGSTPALDFAVTKAGVMQAYGTYSSAGINYARLALACDSSGNATISTQALGTGTAGTVSINGVPVGLGKGNVAGNIAIGTGTIAATATGSENIAIGTNALSAVTIANNNIAIGRNALFNQTVWGANVAIGREALFLSSTGAIGNTSVGQGSLYQNTTGFYNVALGLDAGRLTAVGNNNGEVSYSVFIGAYTKALGAGQTNQIVIGHDATGIGSNSVVLGNDSITKTALKGNVGIGTTAPGAKLEVVATAATGVRESILRASVSDNATSAFHLYNATFVDGKFVPGFSGSVFDNTTPASLVFAAQTDGANDTGTSPLMVFAARTTTSTADPNNGTIGAVVNRPLFTWWNLNVAQMQMAANGNLGIGTTSPTSKLHVVGASPGLTVENNIATGYSEVLFKNTASTGSSIFLNGSIQTGYGGASSLNIYSSSGPLAFHTASVTNALSIAQNGTSTHAGQLIFAPDNTYDIGANGANRPRNVYVGGSVYAASGFGGDVFNYFYSGSTSAEIRIGGGLAISWGGGSGAAALMRFGGTTDAFPAIARDGAGIKFTGAAAGSTSWIKVPPVAVSALPLAATAGAGARAFVNDALAPTFGSAVTGGGAVLVPVYSDGSAWNVG